MVALKFVSSRKINVKNTIIVENLCKEFLVKKPKKGFLGQLSSLFSSHYSTINAIKNLSFTIKKGERVAFIGPNGAGKSTTIKILAGILFPTSGNVSILGYTPWKARKQLAYKIGTVFGQRSQLWYNLPAYDSFVLLAKIYELPDSIFEKRINTLSNQFEIKEFLHQPVRNLSLGQRMRCEIVGSLLHDPEILFLDEPTIGLDVTAKTIIRELLKEISLTQQKTILLTSHDTDDIESVCERVIIIDEGAMIYDNPVSKLQTTYFNKKYLKVITQEEILNVSFPGTHLVKQDPHKATIEVNLDHGKINEIVSTILSENHVLDFTIEDPPMDEIISAIYKGKK